MNEGSARASGNTVTLTKGTVIQRDLTVPAGVTLELTGDGGLYLRDNITLTVNGTVNTPPYKIGFDDGANARTMTINGNGTINLMGKGKLFHIEGRDGVARKLTLDGVTLVGIADNDSPLVGVWEGGELVLVSGAIRGNTISSGGGGVSVGNGGTFTMSGGAITGNTSYDSGGGMFVGEGSTFTMSGGAISGNAAEQGGGVFLWGGTFTMKGGTISGNTSGDNGGGVDVNNGGTFIMEGGVISGNTAALGGGVRVWDQSTFIMEGGTIYGSNEGNNSNKAGGASLRVNANATAAKWGMGGTYTKGGVNQTGGSAIVTGTASRINTDDTLIAIPAR
jgi:hypothetical protein